MRSEGAISNSNDNQVFAADQRGLLIFNLAKCKEMATLPNPPLRRSAALLLCHWLYQDGPRHYKVEILVLSSPIATAAGGFDVELEYEARAAEFDPTDETVSYRFVHKFPILATVQAQVAGGTDPLYIAHANGAPTATQILAAMPGLAAIYDSIALNAATPAVMSSVNTPRL